MNKNCITSKFFTHEKGEVKALIGEDFFPTTINDRKC